MMNFDEFLEATRARVQEELLDTAVKIQQVNKLQGESYIGSSVQPEGAAAAATFNIGPAFERYQMDPFQENAILALPGRVINRDKKSILAAFVSECRTFQHRSFHGQEGFRGLQAASAP